MSGKACGPGIVFPISSNDSVTSALLGTGTPGLEAVHIWISIPFCAMLSATLVGNMAIMAVIWKEHPLHVPRALLPAMLAASDPGLSLFTFPTLLGIFRLPARERTFSACFAHVFFIHTVQDLESGVILVMASDRYAAISHPLRCSCILANGGPARIGLAITVRTLTVQVPLPILLRRPCVCRSNVLSPAYCLHPDIIELSCSNARVNSILGLFAVLSTVGRDFFLILFSYVLILKTVLSPASHGGRLKALSTCASHFSAVTLFSTPMICLSLLHRFGPRRPWHIYVTVANMHFLIPPVMNPIVYVVKTKQIRERILKLFLKKGPGGSQVTFIMGMSTDKQKNAS